MVLDCRKIVIVVLYSYYDVYPLHICVNEQIVPEKSRYQVLSTKVEIRLAKVEAITWKSLEYSDKAIPRKINTLPGIL